MSSEQHYNAVALTAPVQCKTLRRSHNACKLFILHKALFLCRRQLHSCVCLDLACGRGGDLNKLVGCQSYVGVDTALLALSELKRRAAEKGMHVAVHHQDASMPVRPRVSADIVLCNFALHYFCDSKQHCQAFVSSVANQLKPGGVFCGTYEKRVGNVQWGQPYHAKVGDCVNAVEWLVPWSDIIELCYQQHMALVYHQPYHMIHADADDSIIGFIIQKAQEQCSGTTPSYSGT